MRSHFCDDVGIVESPSAVVKTYGHSFVPSQDREPSLSSFDYPVIWPCATPVERALRQRFRCSFGGVFSQDRCVQYSCRFPSKRESGTFSSSMMILEMVVANFRGDVTFGSHTDRAAFGERGLVRLGTPEE